MKMQLPLSQTTIGSGSNGFSSALDLISDGLNTGCFRGAFVKVLNTKFSCYLQSSQNLPCFSIIENVRLWNLGGFKSELSYLSVWS